MGGFGRFDDPREEFEQNFIEELDELLNRYDRGNNSNTEVSILGRYLRSCLDAYNNAIKERTALGPTS